MHVLRNFWFPILLVVATLVICIGSLRNGVPDATVKSLSNPYKEGEEWVAPWEAEIPFTDEGEKIRYGKELIAHTANYLGPKGSIQQSSNGMNCQNCHTFGGTQNFANPFSAVASLYPRYRERSGKTETIVFRINDCMQRSLNSQPLDSNGHEMKAMIAYVKWVGKDVPSLVRPEGAGVQALPFLERAADTLRGRTIYVSECQRCHGENGEGLLRADGVEYVYPPLWGDHSFNTAAGMYRLSALAGFVRNNMPYGVNWKQPQLTVEQAWDVAAYVVSKPRPQLSFSADWKGLSKKPVDYPFGPYADSFTEKQHKYGPFGPIKKSRHF